VMVMAERHGGKRTPRNPAPVSGPGKLSRRTDGGPAQVNAQMTGMAYGENKDFMEIQEGAAMAATPKSKGAMQAPQGAATSAMGAMGLGNPLFSETQRPDEPVTAGVNFGPGAGATLPKPVYSQRSSDDLENMKRYLPDLIEAASFTGAPATFKSLVNYLRNA
jgi:hypothetical protein